MNIDFKKFSVFGCALATAFALTACGDDSGSNPKSDNGNSSSSSISEKKLSSSTVNDDEEDDDNSGKGSNITGNDDNEDSGNHGSQQPASSESSGGNQHGTNSHSSNSSTSATESSTTYTYAITIDENAQTLIVEPPQESGMLCIVNGGSVQWKEAPISLTPLQMKYSFVGDTLVLWSWDDEDNKYYDDGNMYVGGKAGNIYGTWEMISCEYEASSAKTECFNDDDEYIYQLDISKNSIIATQTQRASQIDFVKTNYRNSLLQYLDNGLTYYPSIYELFYKADEIETDFEQIKIVKQTATSETFTLGETTVTVDVKKYDKNSKGRSAIIEISTNESDKSCIGSSEALYTVTKEYCNASNLDYFDIESETDDSGNEFSYADYYEKENNSEFSSCLMNMFNKNSIDNQFFLKASSNKVKRPRHKLPKFFK